MKSRSLHRSTRVIGGIAAAIALTLSACGSDDAGSVAVPEEGTGSAYNDAIIASESHDEIIFAEGGDMVVAVDCDLQSGGTIVTVVADGLEPGIYTGTFEPSTGVDLTLDATAGGQSVSETDVTLTDADYTVTFTDIEGAEFSLRGCPS